MTKPKMKNKHKEAAILTVKNRHGVKFSVGDVAYSFRKRFKIEAFRTDTSAPSWLQTGNVATPTYWVMAKHKNIWCWTNIDYIRKNK